MKKLYIIAAISAIAICQSAGVAAQDDTKAQVPNGGFEESWVDCVPWTYNGNTLATNKVGTTPSNWKISNVSGLNLAGKWLGATQVGDKNEGYESSSAVKLINTANSYSPSQIVPAYITLGTTWSTSQSAGKDGNDGGSFGGINFTERPSGIEFMYKRSRGTEKPDEQSTIVAYLWKGHWTQQNVPVNIVLGTNPHKETMADRDRCVLQAAGITLDGCQGGTVAPSSDAELIAYINTTITENTDEWTKFSVDFEYLSDATPEMLNIIIASGDYFGGASVVGKDNTLIIDDVKLVYKDNNSGDDNTGDNGEENYAGDKYPGEVTIDMGDGASDPIEANVYIEYQDDNKCTLRLPNFTLDDTNIGDIEVPNVTYTVVDNIAHFTGSVEGMSLMWGVINANVTVNGTINAEGVADFTIDVLWTDANLPIGVKFGGSGVAPSFLELGGGSTLIEILGPDATEAEAEYFNLNGVRVSAANLTPGIYVVRQGSKVSKVVIR